MKRVLFVCGLAAFVAVGMAVAKMSPLQNHTRNTYTLTTTVQTAASARVDTIWLNRNVVPLSGGIPTTLNLRPYSGFRTYVTVGPMAPGDTNLLHNAGVVDTVMFVVKKKLGNIVSLVDSTAGTLVRLRSASKTQLISFVIGTGATDTLNCDELFGILRVADTVGDTAGIAINYPVSTETYFKE